LLEAEITKISVNGFITTKISYANMIGDACVNSGADPKSVLEAIGMDSRIGNKYFKYGYSFGGPCFPRDTRALSLWINNQGVSPIISESAGKYNNYHIYFQAEKLLLENKDEYIIEDIASPYSYSSRSWYSKGKSANLKSDLWDLNKLYNNIDSVTPLLTKINSATKGTGMIVVRKEENK